MQSISHEDRVALTRAIMYLLDSWDLSAREQLVVLNLPKGTPTRALRRYRDDTPFPDDLSVMERLEHLVGIADALRTTYPLNPAMGTRWMRQPLRRFNDRTPLAIIVEDGLRGLVAVRAHLDCSFDWDETRSRG